MATAPRGQEAITVKGLRNGNAPSMDAPGEGRVKDDKSRTLERSAARYTEPQTAKVGG